METPDGELDFLEEYSKRYWNERLLNLIMKYGILLDGIRIKSLNGEINSARAIEKALRDAIAEDIVMKTVSFSHLEEIPEMVSEYPELFVNFQGLDGISAEEKERLTKDFYGKRMSYEDIRKYPQLILFFALQ